MYQYYFIQKKWFNQLNIDVPSVTIVFWLNQNDIDVTTTVSTNRSII